MLTEIQYLEKPASSDEKEIAKVIEIFLEGYRKNNYDIFERHILNDAIIEVEAGAKKLTKKEFLDYFKKYNHTIRRLYYHDAIIRLKSPSEAIVYSVCYRHHKDSPLPQVNQRQFRFIKKQTDRRWYIAKSLCVN